MNTKCSGYWAMQCIQFQRIAKTIFHYFNSMLHFYVLRKGMKIGRVILKEYKSTRRHTSPKYWEKKTNANIISTLICLDSVHNTVEINKWISSLLKVKRMEKVDDVAVAAKAVAVALRRWSAFEIWALNPNGTNELWRSRALTFTQTHIKREKRKIKSKHMESCMHRWC